MGSTVSRPKRQLFHSSINSPRISLLMEFENEMQDYEGQDNSPVTSSELRGWYSFAVALDSVGHSGLLVFFPILLDEIGKRAGVMESDHTISCLNAAKEAKCVVQIGNAYFTPSSLVFYATSIAVLIQFFVFTSLGALADHGNNRKKYLMFFGYVTCFLALMMLFVVKVSLWWLAYLIYMFCTITFCASFLFHYAWVPILTRYHPDTLNAYASTKNVFQVMNQVATQVSGKGFAYGYFSSVLLMLVNIGVSLGFGDASRFGLTPHYGLHVAIAIMGIWGIIFLFGFTDPLLKERPGSPIPRGENYILYSYKTLAHTLKKSKKLPQLLKFLVGWFIYADGFSTIAHIAILFAKTELHAPTWMLLSVGVVSPLAAGLGCFVWPRIQAFFKMTTRQLILTHCLLYCLLPAYCLIFLHSMYELLPLSAYHGFLVGATQSACRVVFSEMIPQGYETEFFSLYEITDKGSAWIGPLVTGAIETGTGNMRNAFYFLFVMFLIPTSFFYFVDEEKGKRDADGFASISF